jgi:hypothetical protein
MSQIKPTQIIPGRRVQTNPNSPLPVDLDPAQRNLILEPGTTISDPVADTGSGEFGSGEEAESPLNSTGNTSTESVLEQEDPVPSTPAILSVKEQIIKFQPDGTAKIDLILEVQDIEDAVEYDIRVAKDAGNL